MGLVFYSGQKGWVLFFFLEKKGGLVSFKYYF